ncbi:MAG TPA: MBL fold metallo-hydrolase [Nocardioidaceae bacterium]|nr:MBL fold metallo-hydrolase [Nocardioidaceae bacterium]
MADPAPIPHDAGFVEIADRCWLARHVWFDVNVVAVGGERGLLVVDTHASERAASRVVGHLRPLPGEVVAVVNTHEHFDHTFGNVTFIEQFDAPPIYAHETAADRTVDAGERIKRLYEDDLEDPHREEVQDTRIVPATHTFSSVAVVDLGDRMVELVHPGRGHTGGDVVVRVPDADVLLAGDLVEESVRSGARGVPGYGDDCFPLEWPASLDLLVGLLTPRSVIVPGHGLPVSRDFVEEQRTAIGVVAQTISDVASRGVPADDALDSAEWPFPKEELVHAVRRGYAQLPHGARRLPLA